MYKPLHIHFKKANQNLITAIFANNITYKNAGSCDSYQEKHKWCILYTFSYLQMITPGIQWTS